MDNPIDHIRKRAEAMKCAIASGVGEVGIFWFFRGEIFQASVPHTHGENYGDFVNGIADHCTFWRSIQRLLPAAERYSYDQVPRGRVVYRKRDDVYLVYGSAHFVRNEGQRHAVLEAFHLLDAKAIFREDEHYGDVPGMLEEEGPQKE